MQSFERAADHAAESPRPPSPARPVGDGEPMRRDSCRGAVLLADDAAQARKAAELDAAGAMVVTIAPPASWVRGRLGEHVDEMVERELASRGAPSPYLSAWSAMPDDAEARLADQLFRARTVGAEGIALVLGTLAAIASPTLAPEDSAALAFLVRAAARSGIVVVIDAADARIGGWRPVTVGEMAAEAEAHAEAHADAEAEAEADADAHADADADADAHADADADAEAEADAEADADLDPDLSTVMARALAEPILPPTRAPIAADAQVAQVAQVAHAQREHLTVVADDATTHVELHVESNVDTHVDAPVAPVPIVMSDEMKSLRATIGVPVAKASEQWRSWALALGAARGPQPLAAFERLFTESYMPLTSAIACGLDDPRALRAWSEFREGFERSYADAFATFGATNRRPRLVMDAYDLASKQARLHNARTTHVLVVDSMRWDLGMIVKRSLGERAAGVASLTSESLLWSALPTTTFRQLETLARGMDALRAPAPEPDEGAESLRGRTAETVRRMRVGSRELYKLDVVPAMLSSLEPAKVGADPLASSLEDMGSSITDAIVRHVASLPARTLLLVLGDHGFTVDRRGRITHGGASPEEVLVPALAYLVGDLH